MTFELNMLGLFNFITIVYCFITGLVLICFYPKRDRHDILFGFFLVFLSLGYSISLVKITNIFILFPHLYSVYYPFLGLAGCFIYLFILSKTEVNNNIKKRSWIVFLGPIFLMILVIPLIVKTAAEKKEIVFNIINFHHFSDYEWFIYAVSMIFLWIVLLINNLRIKKYQIHLEETYSTIKSISLINISKTLLIFLCIMTLNLISTLIVLPLNYAGLFITYQLPLILTNIFLLFASLFGILRMYKSSPKLKKKIVKTEYNLLKEKFNILSEEMDKKQYFLDPELTLPKLADQICFYRNELSEVINKYNGTNFYWYINQLRVDFFIQKYKEVNNKFTIVDIAFMSGFNSKSSFYKVFKAIMNKSPKEYMKSL